MVHNWCSEFVPHRHLRRRQVLIAIPREYIDAPKFCVSLIDSNRLFILLLQAEAEISHLTQKLHAQIENKP
jgi:hypothetical protein